MYTYVCVRHVEARDQHHVSSLITYIIITSSSSPPSFPRERDARVKRKLRGPEPVATEACEKDQVSPTCLTLTSN